MACVMPGTLGETGTRPAAAQSITTYMEAARREAILAHYAAQVDRSSASRPPSPDTRPLPSRTRSGRPGTSTGDTPPSAREITVLAGIAAGLSNSDIAHELIISEETVETHVRHLLWKLEAHNRAHAVAIGYQRSLLHLPRAA